jgi:hypothetical protein
VGRNCTKWVPLKRKKYEVRSIFHELSTLSVSSFPWKSIWKVKVPLRVSFFMWTTSLGKNLTSDNLRKRGLIVVGWCCMCKRSGKSIDLLLHYEVSQDLCDALFTLFDITWVMPERVIDLLACWKCQVGTHSVIVVWRITPLCLKWTKWREQNARYFKDHEKSKNELKNNLVKSLFNWAGDFNISFSNFSHFVEFCNSFRL